MFRSLGAASGTILTASLKRQTPYPAGANSVAIKRVARRAIRNIGAVSERSCLRMRILSLKPSRISGRGAFAERHVGVDFNAETLPHGIREWCRLGIRHRRHMQGRSWYPP